MVSPFKIFVDRLRGADSEKINFSISPEFLDVQEKELLFPQPVLIEGEAYVVDDNLLLNLKVKTTVALPCTVCNAPASKDLNLQVTLVEPLSAIPSAIYDFSTGVREEILLHVPLFLECGDNCPQREILTPYLKKPSSHFPFANL